MMDYVLLYPELFVTFFVIGIFTFGGGYAMLSLIQTQIVVSHGWLTQSMFTDIVAISQMTPGPIGINCATYTGYTVLQEAGAGHLMSILGSFTATFALMLPSFIIVLLLVKAYNRLNGNSKFEDVMSWLRPAVVGLIAGAAVILIVPENFPDWKSWVLFVAALGASFFLKASPILLIILGGVAGFLIY